MLYSMTITSEEVLLHLQQWHDEQTLLWVAYSSPAFSVHCAFSGLVDAVNGDQIVFAHKAGRPDALLSIILSQAESLSYFQWDELEQLKALAPQAEEWMHERPMLGILFPNQTAVVLSDLGQRA